MDIRISQTNPNFTAINTKSVEKVLQKKRLVGLTTGRPEEYTELEKSQIDNPFDIVLTKGIFKSLKAKIVSKDGDVVWKHEESFWDGIRNANPNKFIAKMCMMADYFKNNPKMAERWASIIRAEEKTNSFFKKIQG